jgi:hypothetical protein
VARLEVVRERNAFALGLRRAQQLELFAAFCDELVFVDGGRRRRGGLLIGHGRRVARIRERARGWHFSPSGLNKTCAQRPSILRNALQKK